MHMPNSMCKCMTHPLPNLSPPRTDAGTVLSILGKYIRILGKYIWTGLGHDPKIALSAQILDTHSRIDIIISQRRLRYMRVVAEGHGCTTPRYAYIFYDVECDRSDFARLYSVPVLNRSPPSMSSRWFFVNKPVSCTMVEIMFGIKPKPHAPWSMANRDRRRCLNPRWR